MIPREIISKIKRIQITTSRKVTDVFAGQYQSVFKGSGMEFSEVREYTAGDEIRSIDWNVTARMGHPYVKKFVEERELTIMILLDTSMSCRYGTVARPKSELAAEVSSVIAFSAIQNNDKVGMITFGDRVRKYIPPRKGARHALRVVREALYNTSGRGITDMNGALEFLNRVTKRKTITFILSDFFAPDFRKTLSILNKKHDIIAIVVTDPSELVLPRAGIVDLHDAETGEPYAVDTSYKKTARLYNENAGRVADERRKLFRSVNVDSIDISTDASYAVPLTRFFRMRERRKARH
ncbi:MAG: DUF58 domain-containing protein [Candidatus Omnitrophota bacterium]